MRAHGLSWLLVAAAMSASVLPAHADVAPTKAPLPHEYVPFDPATDGELGAVTVEGGLAATLSTPSGPITAPDVGRPIGDKTPLYSEKAAVPDYWKPDRDTKRPESLAYDDPYRPRLAPFKRAIALDAVDSDYRLYVRDPRHRTIDIEKAKEPLPPVDPFYADIALDIRGGEAIRIPGVLGGAVVMKATLSGGIPFHLETDSAENLFLVADGTGKARLAMEIRAPRFGFGGRNPVIDWGDLKTTLLPKLPSNVDAAAKKVAKEIGIDSSTMRPAAAIERLVDFFRSFVDSETPPTASSDIYLDLVSSKKGVCRHRAFAFMVTALGLGIPTRFVQNEAHAWVEVHDGEMWRRIDLGGAGRLLDDKSEVPEQTQPAHDPPGDPYAWPRSATKGSDMVPPPGASSPGGGSTPTPTPSPAPTTSSSASSLPPSKLTLTVEGDNESLHEVARKTLAVKGKLVDGSGAACKSLSVHITLRNLATKKEETIGTPLLTDEGGNYDGKITLPSSLDLGDYEVLARTPGNASCGAGSTE